MKPELDQELESTFAKLQTKADGASAKQQQEDAFLAEFRRHTESVIWPAMEEFGAKLRARGYRIDTERQRAHYDEDHRQVPASVGMVIHSGDVNGNGTLVLKIFCHPDRQKVAIVDALRSGYSQGKAEEVGLGEVTADLVQQRLLRTFQRVTRTAPRPSRFGETAV